MKRPSLPPLPSVIYPTPRSSRVRQGRDRNKEMNSAHSPARWVRMAACPMSRKEVGGQRERQRDQFDVRLGGNRQKRRRKSRNEMQTQPIKTWRCRRGGDRHVIADVSQSAMCWVRLSLSTTLSFPRFPLPALSVSFSLHPSHSVDLPLTVSKRRDGSRCRQEVIKAGTCC